MDDRLLDKIAKPFNVTVSENYESITEMVDDILPKIRKFSIPSFHDEDSPLEKKYWILMNDHAGYTKRSLHRFKGSREISIAVDGKMESSYYEIEEAKRIIIGESRYRNGFLYELAFMDNDFMIFVRHGNRANIPNPYIFYCAEPIGMRLNWDEALEKLVAKYRDNQMPWGIVLIILVIVLGIIVYLR